MGRNRNKGKRKTSGKWTDQNLKDHSKSMDNNSWVNRLRFISIENLTNDEKVDPQYTHCSAVSTTTISILSWNVLAEAYCSRYSQVQLPAQFQKVVFNSAKRKTRILHVLERFCTDERLDVICLQEVDMPEIREKMISLGYLDYVETPRTIGGGAGGRTDGCAVYVRSCETKPVVERPDDKTKEPLEKSSCNDSGSVDGNVSSPILWQMIDSEIVRLDDLATLSSQALTQSVADKIKTNSCSNIQGISTSFSRRNMALIVRLRNIVTQETIIIANAHLYWNPGFEYVKLCQAHYILLRVRAFQSTPQEPVVLCGDLNSRPGGVTHSYLSNGFINAKLVAPWYSLGPHDEDTSTPLTTQTISTNEKKSHIDSTADTVSESLIDGLEILNFNKEKKPSPKFVYDKPKIRYLCDASLNKLCRWLRILGQDVALETDNEEKLRTGVGEMVIFDRCLKERRTLVTTSPRLMQRRDCPSNVYCIHPPFLSHLEVAMVHILLVHGVVLEPSTFLSRCVVCNGNIVEVHDDITKRRILSEYEAPHALIDEGMAVYVCNGCQQGYWWNDRPTSSASRVKTAATRLLELCVRGGVPVREDDNGTDGLFEHVKYKELRQDGWNYETPGSELLQQQLDVVEWLRAEKLLCPFALESAYLLQDISQSRVGEILPFTNVTHNFVDTLDYVFFEKTHLHVLERLYVPMSLSELSDGRSNIQNSYLLPSDIWPSDHLAIAVRLKFRATEFNNLCDQSNFEPNSNLNSETPVEQEFKSTVDSSFSKTMDKSELKTLKSQTFHGHRCACGCVPPIPSLFEMAEYRKQRKQKGSYNSS